MLFLTETRYFFSKFHVLIQTMQEKINAKHYNIEIGNHADSSFSQLLNSQFAKAKKVIIVDDNTNEHCLPILLSEYEELKDAEIMLLPAGEENKVMEVCFQVWEALTEYSIGRNDLVINLGGGVVTDMGGFIASIYKRGVCFINLPTTLLAMVDASVGGKTGVDLGIYKNQLGVFSFPSLVVIDPVFLQTLCKEEKLWGKAEMLKHGLIESKEHWDSIKNKNSEEIDAEDILISIDIKNKIVLEDPKEKNIRKKLNFGHTVGHAIEGYYLTQGKIPHGLAVAIGMIVEAKLSENIGYLSTKEFLEIYSIVSGQYPKLTLDDQMIDSILSLMQNDKKNNTGKINFTLLKGIGKATVDHYPTLIEVKKALSFLKD